MFGFLGSSCFILSRDISALLKDGLSCCRIGLARPVARLSHFTRAIGREPLQHS
jgi:hypothetical protein